MDSRWLNHSCLLVRSRTSKLFQIFYPLRKISGMSNVKLVDAHASWQADNPHCLTTRTGWGSTWPSSAKGLAAVNSTTTSLKQNAPPKGRTHIIFLSTLQLTGVLSCRPKWSTFGSTFASCAKAIESWLKKLNWVIAACLEVAAVKFSGLIIT